MLSQTWAYVLAAGKPSLVNTGVQPTPKLTTCGTISAMIDKELLDILVCPLCKTPVVLQGEALKCSQCRRVYPIKDDIPIMLVQEATIDPQ